MEQKYLYILFFSGQSKISRFIKYMTKYPYNHVSLSLDDTFAHMYSFSRYYRKAAFYGGLVEESILRYYISGVDKVRIFRIPISVEEYELLQKGFQEMFLEKDKYIYNMLSAILVPFHKRCHIWRAYTCVEFAAMILSRLKDPKISEKAYVNIPMLQDILKDDLFYEGNLGTISVSKGWGNDEYSKDITLPEAAYNTASHMTKLVLRLVCYSHA